MNRPGWNPSRRNRKIGSADSGWGRDNRLTIPGDWRDDRVFWERLRDPVCFEKTLHSGTFTVLVEPTTAGFIHPCTPEDLFAMVELLPVDDVSGIATIVLRQPRRKEVVMSSVWGRLGYWADLGPHSGPTVFLEAQEVGKRLRWSASINPASREELERLRQDGHKVEHIKRHYEWKLELHPCRATQLYRTLVHEVGHYVDKTTSIDAKVASLSENDPLRVDIANRYWSKPHNDKEAFAHHYASKVAAYLKGEGLIPFDRKFDQDQIAASGANPSWFVPTA